MGVASLVWVPVLGIVSGSWVHMPSPVLYHRVRPAANILLSADANDSAAAANDALIGQMRASVSALPSVERTLLVPSMSRSARDVCTDTAGAAQASR